MKQKILDRKNIEIGQRIREIRDDLGYTREKFAEILNVSESTLANVELGRTYVSQIILSNLYEKFGISSDDILHGTSKTTNTQNKINCIVSNLNTDECKHLYKIIVDILL